MRIAWLFGIATSVIDGGSVSEGCGLAIITGLAQRSPQLRASETRRCREMNG
jgi:hypothetical protein